MDEILYEALTKYFNTLELSGYMPRQNGFKLLILCFYRDYVFQDFRGLLSKTDYCLIERALDCIYGTSCLIPYPDYLKMGKLYLGELTEMAQRVKALEDTNVVKVMHGLEEDPQSDVQVVSEE